MKYSIKKLNQRKDARGFLVDFLSLDELEKADQTFGQIYYVTFDSPFKLRGNHYHTHKKEWFVVINGKLQVRLEDINTKSRVEFVLDANKEGFKRIEINENIAHAFRNVSKTALMFNYCNRPYRLSDSDTFPYKLL